MLMRRLLTICVIAVSTTVAQAAEVSARGLESEFNKRVLPFLKTYCLDCHGEDTQEAKLNLSSYKSVGKVNDAHKTWEIVLERLEAGEMPPEDADPRPSDELRRSVVKWIKDLRRFEAQRNAGDPGVVLVRRLSNAEYNYTIRDLTGVDIRPTRTFPVDPANEAGFDNSGESLAMSPALLKKYLAAAREVASHMVLTQEGIAFAPHPVATDTDRDKYCVKRIVQFYQRQPTDLADYFFAAWQFRQVPVVGKPVTSLGQIAEQNRVSPKYLKTVWETLTTPEEIGPMAKLQSMWSGLPNDPKRSANVRTKCAEMRDYVVGLRRQLKRTFPNLYIAESHKGSQPFVLWKNDQYASHRRQFDATMLKVKSDQLPKDYPREFVIPTEADRARYEAAVTKFCSIFPDAFFVSERGRDYLDKLRTKEEAGRLLSAGFHSMMGYYRDDTPLYDMVLSDSEKQELDGLWQELDFVTSAAARQYSGFLWFERTDSKYMREPQFDFARPENKSSAEEKMVKDLSVVYLEKAKRVGGGDTELGAITKYFKDINRQLRWVEKARLAAEPNHLAAIEQFAGKAFRRPLTASERQDLLAFYQSLREEDELSHEDAIQDTLVSILMSPHFSYRLDLAVLGEQKRHLTDTELASRLSYFLWSSSPDARLIDLADRGELNNPKSLEAEMRRMLKDRRVVGLATEFGGNWLDIRRFEEHNSVDRNRFPAFTDELRQAMFEEPIRFLTHVIQMDAPALDLIDGDYTFVNNVLAKHYGIDQEPLPDGYWTRFSKAAEIQRGGLLPMAAFLTKNAPGLRTSPVKRGYWVVRRLLGERIPPPPPNVPDLPEDETKIELPLRDLLAKHRDNKLCAGCHDRFDSIGLSFEGFGPIGELRSRDLGGRAVETKAVFPDGSEGKGIAGLRQYLKQKRQDDFLNNLCRKLLSYALGRTLQLSDEMLIEDMRRSLNENEFKLSAAIQAIVSSPQFQTKRGQSKQLSQQPE